jgi:hypothetical protein
MTQQQVNELEDPTTRAGLIDERYRWPNSIVYYELTPRAFSKTLFYGDYSLNCLPTLLQAKLR